jgi:Tol biopolymer transport system component
MKHVSRFEQELTAWFVDTAAPRTPDYTDEILGQTVHVRQRPGWSFPERWLPLTVFTLARRTLKPGPWRTIGLLAILALLLAVAISAFVGSQPRLPSPFGPAANGLIAYAAEGDIVTVDPRSGSIVTLVGGRARDQYPAWSSDGTRIAFERAVAGGTKVVSANSAGGQLLELIQDPVEAVRGLTWSPDGSALAFSNGDLWIVAADGSGGRLLEIGFRAEFPVWRPPDGREILFSNASGPGLFLVRRDGSVLRPLTFSDGTIVDDDLASWTPDGRRLVSVRQETGADGQPAYRLHVMILGVDGRIADDRVVGPPMLPSIGSNLSPDGTRVLFAIESPDRAGWRMGVVSIDGSEPTILAGPTFTGDERICAWSPDGTLIIVNEVEQQETWLLDPGGGPGRLGDWSDPSGEPPAWQRVAP